MQVDIISVDVVPIPLVGVICVEQRVPQYVAVLGVLKAVILIDEDTFRPSWCRDIVDDDLGDDLFDLRVTLEVLDYSGESHFNIFDAKCSALRAILSHQGHPKRPKMWPDKFLVISDIQGEALSDKGRIGDSRCCGEVVEG